MHMTWCVVWPHVACVLFKISVDLRSGTSASSIKRAPSQPGGEPRKSWFGQLLLQMPTV